MTGAPATPVRDPGLFASIREAIAGSHQDYTDVSIERAIILLSVPMVLEMCMESLFGVVDVFWVAHLGSDAIATLGGIGLIFIAFAKPIVHIFTSDPSIALLAVTCLRYLSYGYVSYAYGMVVVGSFNGAGDTFTPTILNLICFWACQIPLAYFLAFPAGMGPTGPFVSVVVSDSLLAVLGILWFRRGKWKERVV